MELRLPLATLRRGLWRLISTLAYCGLCAELWKHFDYDDPYDLVEFFGLSYEQNLPTWVASLQLATCGGLLSLCAISARKNDSGYARYWWGLAGIFFYISLDEFVQLHEQMNHWFDLGGVLYFGWVIPAAGMVAGIGLFYLRFLLQLPVRTRNLFVLAGTLFVGGALGVELLLGYWTDLEGDRNLVYGLIDLVEESMELSGVAVFVFALTEHLAGGSALLSLRMGEVSAESADASLEFRRRISLLRLAFIWAAASLLVVAILQTGSTEYFRYEDKRGHALLQESDQGPDLSEVLKGGSRFRYVAAQREFDKQPELRTLLIFGIGAGVLALSRARRQPA